jgi:hypothetical protein
MVTGYLKKIGLRPLFFCYARTSHLGEELYDRYKNHLAGIRNSYAFL